MSSFDQLAAGWRRLAPYPTPRWFAVAIPLLYTLMVTQRLDAPLGLVDSGNALLDLLASFGLHILAVCLLSGAMLVAYSRIRLLMDGRRTSRR